MGVFMLNTTMDYVYLVHEPYIDEFYILDTVPYGEFNPQYLDVQNPNHLIAADIYVKREYRIPISNSERNCIETTVDQFINCYRNEMLEKIRGNITCWLPIMRFLRFPKDWPDCTDETEA